MAGSDSVCVLSKTKKPAISREMTDSLTNRMIMAAAALLRIVRLAALTQHFIDKAVFP